MTYPDEWNEHEGTAKFMVCPIAATTPNNLNADKFKCHFCDVEVWVSKVSQKMCKENNLLVTCRPCIENELENYDKIEMVGLTKEQRDEIKKASMT